MNPEFPVPANSYHVIARVDPNDTPGDMNPEDRSFDDATTCCHRRQFRDIDSPTMRELPAHVPKGYDAFLRSLKLRIKEAQLHASLSVNRELIFLYWQIGRDILTRQKTEGWGAKIVERLAKDLRGAFPDMSGFSRANLMYMRAFADAYPQESIVQQVVGQIPYRRIASIAKGESADHRSARSGVEKA